MCRSSKKSQNYHRGNRRNPKSTINSIDTTTKDDNSSEEEYIFSVKNNPCKRPVAKLNIHGLPIEFIIDTGATVNLIEQRDFSPIQNKVKMHPTSVKVYPYKSCKPLKILGTFSAQVKNSDNSDNAFFFVVPNDRKLGASLLSFSTARNLGLIALTNRIALSIKRRSVLIPDELFHGVVN